MATITRWDPWNDMLSLREAMSQLMEESYVRPDAARGQGFVPALDVSETQDAFLVEAAVPGLKPEDLEITVENSVLTIKGETRQENTAKERNFHRIERRFGSFQRTIGLPKSVQADAIKANLEHGVLKLEIPKAEEIKPRKISVNVTSSKTLENASNN
ncbi:MAG: Hsp20/alpha crystallin family protein [Chloroflexi bacterium SZAS-1]|jgi:HSP20 family protein|nr:Hsp20/alpha crystallin family protein [Chloroflexi bacterium SZAS-1]